MPQLRRRFIPQQTLGWIARLPQSWQQQNNWLRLITAFHRTQVGDIRTAAYGKYLIDIVSCTSCHAENLAGNYGQLDGPLGPNLTTWVQNWSEAEFATALQSGVLPDGRVMSKECPGSPTPRCLTQK
ncbi:hypothetical protein [Candidatus Leptofilum sp.]|uniref:hypothetical protein n=1 Tax=Candidatus Leptofilum sp. TaxID=3241576 RepID=UPI003B5A13DF